MCGNLIKYDPSQLNWSTKKAYKSVGANHGLKVSLKTAFRSTPLSALQKADNAYLKGEQNKQERVKSYIDNADYLEEHTNGSIRKMMNRDRTRPRTSKGGDYLRQRSYTLTCHS